MFYNLSSNQSEKIIKLIDSKNYEDIFKIESIFSGYYETKENVFFFRDTLGVAPLFYRIINKKINISIRITDLIIKDDKINKQGAMSFISFGNTRILPLIDNINICPPGTIIKFNKKLGSTKLLFRYKLKPRNLNKLNNFQLLEEYKKIFLNSVSKNQINKKKIIFLSGGIDSACIAISDNDISESLTFLPWGDTSTEKKYAEENAKISKIRNQKFLSVDENMLNKNMPELLKKYGGPLGSIHYLVIDHAFSNNFLDNYQTLCFGQNLDTLSCSAGAQGTSVILPGFIRNIIFKEKSIVNFFLKRNSGFLSKINYEIINKFIDDDYSDYQKIILSGIYITHTPIDSEYFVIPSLINNKKIFNPYYNIELVEFFLGLKKKIYVDLSKNTWKFPFKIDKLLQKKLWFELSNHQELQPKKGFYLSKKYNPINNLIKPFPKYVEDKPLNIENQKFAAQSLIDLCNEYNLKNTLDIR